MRHESILDERSILSYRTSPRNHYCSTQRSASFDETFYDLFIPEFSETHFLYFMPHFPFYHFLRTVYAVSLPFCLISVWCMPLRSVCRMRDRPPPLLGSWVSPLCVRRRTTPADTRSTLQISPSTSYRARSLFAYQLASLVKLIQWKSF